MTLSAKLCRLAPGPFLGLFLGVVTGIEVAVAQPPVKVTDPALLRQVVASADGSRIPLGVQVRSVDDLEPLLLDHAGSLIPVQVDSAVRVVVELDVSAIGTLAGDPRVSALRPIFYLSPDTREGIEMLGWEGDRPYDGSGVGVAVIDSGINSTHEYLGASVSCTAETFVNGKVVGGYDFGVGDNNPCTRDDHGNAIAGIIAGDRVAKGTGPGREYIGGVAPGASLYALKITKKNGRPGSNALLEALKWINQNWDANPDAPILVVNISNSWNDKPLDKTCDGSASSFALKMFHVLEGLRKRGITVFNSAGNSSYKNGVKWPGCFDSLNTVGAVYDTSGKVQPHSNSGSLLDFFAPGSRAYTTGAPGKIRKFGTTSAATAYASGAAAVIQQAARTVVGRYLTAEELTDLMATTGRPVKDSKVSGGLTRPLIDIDAAIRVIEDEPGRFARLGG